MENKSFEETLLDAKQVKELDIDDLIGSIVDNDSREQLVLDDETDKSIVSESKTQNSSVIEHSEIDEQKENNIVAHSLTSDKVSKESDIKTISSYEYVKAKIVIVVTEQKPMTRLQFDFLNSLVKVSTVDESLKDNSEEKFLELKELRKQSIKIQMKVGDVVKDKGDILPTQVRNLIERLTGLDMLLYLNGELKDISLAYALQK